MLPNLRIKLRYSARDNAEMNAQAWNAKFPVGTIVIVTLADRRRRLARTIGIAQHIGQHDFIEVDRIRPGFVLLRWCWPVTATGVAFLARRAVSRPHPLDVGAPKQ